MHLNDNIMSRRIPYDVDWAETLLGMEVVVPNGWFDGYDDNDDTPNDGEIVAINWSNDGRRFFQVEVEGHVYDMRYDAVFSFANDSQRDFDQYHLPTYPIANPERDRVRVVHRRRQRSSSEGDTSDTASSTDDDSDNESNDGGEEDNAYTRTDPADWVVIEEGSPLEGRWVEPIEYTGTHDLFTSIIDGDDINDFKDSSGDIRFDKILEYTLPLFGDNDDVSLFEWQAARMQNYMIHIISDDDIKFKPKYYNPEEGLIITADHVARFYGVLMARMQTGNSSIDDIWSTRSTLKAVACIKESMPQDAFKDLCRCMHFADDWEEDDDRWNEKYQHVKDEPSEDTAHHRRKFGMLEDAYNRRWQAIVHFGRCVTADESRVAGWYHSPMTVGPEPKPIRTGATLHTLCVTFGPLATYKLFARAYGGKSDGDLDHINDNTFTTQKWVNLYDIMLDPFKGEGRFVTMDSAYMGDIMAQIGHHEWGMNMVGTTNDNRTGADTKDKKKGMKKCTYESIMFQHKTEPLCYAMWADNNIVRTLSNCHPPKIIIDGLMRKGKTDGVRDRTQSPVPCPQQNQYYSQTFHLIDKGNCNEAKYDIGMESHKHGWAPKLSLRYFNMTLNNAYQIYESLVHEYTPDRRYMSMGEAIELATHSLLQKGEPMRERACSHPNPIRDLTTIFDTGSGNKVRSDAKGEVATGGNVSKQSRVPSALATLRRKQRTQPWMTHQSVAQETAGKCSFDFCPNIKLGKQKGNKRPRGHDTFMKCIECSAIKGSPVYFCNTTKKGKPCLCHWRHHMKYFSVAAASSNVEVVLQEGTADVEVVVESVGQNE